MDAAVKRQRKEARLQELAIDAKDLFAAADQAAPIWLDNELNNARLVATTLYHGRLPEFRALLQDCDNDLACFYSAARKLADST